MEMPRQQWGWIGAAAVYVALLALGPLWLFTEAVILGAALGLAAWSLRRFAPRLGAWRWLWFPIAFLAWAVLVRAVWLGLIDRILLS